MLRLKQVQLMRHILLLGLSVAPLVPFTAHSDEGIVINNRETLSTARVSAPLITIRPVTTKANLPFLNSRITKDLIVRSAISFPEVQTELERLGISDPASMQMADFVAAIQASEYAGRYLYEGDTRKQPGLERPVAISRYAQSGQRAWDARTLTNMVITGVIDTTTPHSSIIDGMTVEWFSFDEQYIRTIDNIQRGLWHFEAETRPADVQRIFTSLTDDVRQYHDLQRSMLENIGQITFGFPIIYTADEMGLRIPSSIRKSYDVYWADLVVTYYSVDPEDLAEMAFNVAVPKGSVALKLVPLRFGVEVTRRDQESTPEIGLEYGGMKVSVGEYFSRAVSYKYLKPIIEAYGEGQRQFSWKMKDEAIAAGSHRFAAILGVPKGTLDLDLAFSGHVRLRKSFIGEWYDGELIAGTGAWLVPVSF